MLGHSATGAEPLGGPAPLEAELGAYGLFVGAGAFTLAGQDVDFLRTRIMPAGVATFTLAGQPAGLNRGFWIDQQPAAFVVSGQSVTFLRGYAIDAAAGSFVLTGPDTASRVYRIIANPGDAFTLAGQDARLMWSGARLKADQAGEFIVTDGGLARFSRGSSAIRPVTGAGFRLTFDDVVASAGDEQLTNTRITGVGFRLRLDDTTTRGGL